MVTRRRINTILLGALAAVLLSTAGIVVASAITSKQSQTLSFFTTPATPSVIGEKYVVQVISGDSLIPITLRINPAVCSISKVTDGIIFTSNPAGLTVGDTYKPTATDGAQATVTFTHAGTCIISANQGGDSAYTKAATVKQDVAVEPNA